MSSAFVLPALDNTMGALYLGVIFSMALWGAGSVQMYYYFNMYSKDDWRLKVLVFVVWALDTLHQGLITASCYSYLVSNYANPVHLGVLEKTLLDMVIVTAIICLIVQSFFTMRIWRLSHKNIYLTGGVYLWVLAQFVSTLVYFGKAYKFVGFAELLTIKNLTRSINVVSAVTDAVIAAALVYLLRSSRTGFKSSETILNRLIVFTINTGLLTGMSAVVCLIMNIAFPDTFLYILFYLMVSRLYMNSLLATLNSRKNLSGGMPDANTESSHSVSMGRLRSRTVGAATYGTNANPHLVSIKVDTETTRDDGSKHPVHSPSDSDLESAYPRDKPSAF